MESEPILETAGGATRLAVNWPCTATVAAIAAGIRRRTLETVVRRRGGYLVQSCSAAEILGVLCAALASVSPRPADWRTGVRHHSVGSRYLNPGGSSDHRLIVSPGHYALALYAALIEVGRLPEDALSL